MKVIAKLNYLRISPRKVRQISNLIKGMKITEAENQLKFLVARPSRPLLKLLKSAVANAKNNFNLDKENLFISNILVNQGPSLKRWMPRARGVASPILKRTSHITLILEGKKEAKKIKKKIEKPIKEKPEEKVKKEEIKPKEKKKWEKPLKEERVQAKRRLIPKIFRRKSI